MTDDSPLSTPVHSDTEDSDSDAPRRRAPHADSEPSGEDLVESAHRDYRAIPALDTYEGAGLDNEEYAQMTVEQRLNADLEIRRRRHAARGALDFEWDSDDELSILARREHRPQRRGDDHLRDLQDLLRVDPDNPITLQEQPLVLAQYLERPEVRREVIRRFHDFLVNFKDETGEAIYLTRIRTMGARNQMSFEVQYPHFAQTAPIIAVWVGDAPGQMLPILDEAAFILVQTEAFFPEFARIAPEVHVRVSGLPVIDSIGSLRQMHLNALVRTPGVVTKATSVFPQLRIVKWRCGRCNASIGPFACTEETPRPPTFCPTCNARSGFRIDSGETVYRNYQRITIQEPPGTVGAGRIPRVKDVVLLADLTDTCRPGEQIEVTGIYKHVMEVRRSGFPVFATMLEANHISRSSDAFSAVSITEEEKRQILELSHRPDIARLIFDSIAPSIFGHDDIKASITLALFGGRRKDVAGRHSVRGDINVLLLGDPGTAKSQFLKCAEAIAPRAVFTTGKGASAVGLTASVHRDAATGEWTLEGGALVLADGGVCLIDEFDKMSEKDRTSIHEAMEQQSISISKAGIVTTLFARCSVIAACNPVRGRYDGSQSFGFNAGLSDPIISRFDVLCVVRDVVDAIQDGKLAEAVVRAHQGHPVAAHSLEEGLLRKYIAYARQNCHPRMTDVDNRKIISLYQELRRESAVGGGTPITVRHLESIIRLSEAHARLHLRSNVNETDVNFAIALLLRSFVSTQKYADKKPFERKFVKYLSYGRDRNDLLMHVIHTMVGERMAFWRLRRGVTEAEERILKIPKTDFEARGREVGVVSFHEFYQSEAFAADFTQTPTDIIREL